MSGFFDPNSSFMTALGKIFDIMMISIIWVLFSLPVITIGASTTALYYATVKSIRRDRGYYIKEFWRAFKTNFKYATIIWAILLVLAALFAMNLKFAAGAGGNLGMFLLVVYCAIIFVIAITTAYIFPVLSRFSMKFTDLVKMSVFIGMKHLPFSIIFIIIILVSAWFLRIMPALAFFLPGLSTLLYSLLMERILKKYTPQTTEEGKDTWYLE